MDEYSKIKSLELELVNPDARKDVRRLNELISDEFEEFGSSGVIYRKQDILSFLPQEEPVKYELSDFTFKRLSEGCILVKYRSVISGKHTFRSSIWINDNGSWQMLHHQATVICDGF